MCVCVCVCVYVCVRVGFGGWGQGGGGASSKQAGATNFLRISQPNLPGRGAGVGGTCQLQGDGHLLLPGCWLFCKVFCNSFSRTCERYIVFDVFPTFSRHSHYKT